MTLRRSLIIKLGALGDVVRTTPLLERLPGETVWITDRSALPLLADRPGLTAVPLEEAASAVGGKVFDLVVCFDEDARALRAAARAKTRRRVGAYLDAGRRTYCRASAPWFDMSLISRHGKAKADRLKAANRRTYQDHLFSACGWNFSGEECWVPAKAARGRGVLLETRVGPRWPGKAWPGFDALGARLESAGLEHSVLVQRARLRRYVEDVAAGSALVCGDTLAMHLGLALKKRVVAVFNCTSPWEIHGYGRLTRVVNPRLEDFFYTRGRLPESAAVPVETVWDALRPWAHDVRRARAEPRRQPRVAAL